MTLNIPENTRNRKTHVELNHIQRHIQNYGKTSGDGGARGQHATDCPLARESTQTSTAGGCPTKSCVPDNLMRRQMTRVARDYILSPYHVNKQ